MLQLRKGTERPGCLGWIGGLNILTLLDLTATQMVHLEEAVPFYLRAKAYTRGKLTHTESPDRELTFVVQAARRALPQPAVVCLRKRLLLNSVGMAYSSPVAFTSLPLPAGHPTASVSTQNRPDFSSRQPTLSSEPLPALLPPHSKGPFESSNELRRRLPYCRAGHRRLTHRRAGHVRQQWPDGAEPNPQGAPPCSRKEMGSKR